MIREKFKNVGVLVLGSAKSAGTIISMAADEILMGPSSSLGPIDAQMNYRGQILSADAIINEFEGIKEEAAKGGLNRAYIPGLQNIPMGTIEGAKNAKAFAIDLVTKWLAKYKFRNWEKHSSSGEDVTHNDRIERAKEIATKLSDHTIWRSHGRSIKINDLTEMKLKITDYSKNTKLNEACNGYYTLMRMTFESMNMFKLFETSKEDSQIYRFQNIANAPAPVLGVRQQVMPLMAEAKCGKCNKIAKIQANFKKEDKLIPGAVKFPSNNIWKCRHCENKSDISNLRRQIESQFKAKIIG